MKVASPTQVTAKMCLWVHLLKNNQVGRFVKFVIWSMSGTHVGDLANHGDILYVSPKANQLFLFLLESS